MATHLIRKILLGPSKFHPGATNLPLGVLLTTRVVILIWSPYYYTTYEELELDPEPVKTSRSFSKR